MFVIARAASTTATAIGKRLSKQAHLRHLANQKNISPETAGGQFGRARVAVGASRSATLPR